MGIVYLLHFERKLKHAQHYIGYTNDLAKRLKRHNDKQGSHLVAAVVKNGIGFILARTWENVDYAFERQLKKRKNTKYLCPICRKEKENKENGYNK